MGMTDNTKRLIMALSTNDIVGAKKCAIACMSEDTTSKNAIFINKYKPILEHATSLIELPPNLKYKLEALDMSTFREDRYYLSKECEDIVNEISKMRVVSEKLSELQIPYLNSTLLYGESGTGKTTLAKYIAYKMNLPYVYINFSQIIDSLMGKTSSTINLAFNFVKTTPCIFMIDEIDAIGIKRSLSSNSGADGEINRVTITMMQELDNLPNDVILIAATNRKDIIDEALLRRFSLKKEIHLPTEEEKIDIANMYVNTVPYKFEYEDLINKANTQADIVNLIIKRLANTLINT